MLKSHMDAVEKYLVYKSKVLANAGHTLHKGTPRESFVKEFLVDHLGSDVSVGTGEIIDCDSQPSSSRNQYDIVIYRNDFPKLEFYGGINGFLIESVVATVEVKSLLNEAGILQSVKAAKNAKALSPSVKQGSRFGWVPPKVANYVVAYDGPAKMSTVYDWIVKAHTELAIPMPTFAHLNRIGVSGTALDGVFLLNKGFVKLDNSPLSLNDDNNPKPGTHVISDSDSGNLLMFFLALHEICNNLQAKLLDPVPYVQSADYKNITVV